MAKKKERPNPSGPVICMRCFGFGVLADNPEQQPMQYFRHLPAATKELPFYEELEGLPCPDCDGTGLFGEP